MADAIGGGTVELVPVPLEDRRLVERFLRVPWFIYREHRPSPHWVPPLLIDRRDFLNPRKNPFFDHAECAFWIATLGGRDVGRIAAVEDADWARHTGERVGSFGLFESPDDRRVSDALLDAATAWLRKRELQNVVGPLDLSTNYVCGLLVEGFDQDPFVQMPYNPPYYEDLLRGFGFTKTKDLWEWYGAASAPIPERVHKIAARARERSGINIRTINMKDWDAEVGRALEVYNDAWFANWGFVPLGEKEFRHIAKDLKLVVRPEMAFLAEIGGETVALALTIGNINPILKKVNGRLVPFGIPRLLWDLKVRPKVNEGRLIILGVKRAWRHRGIEAILYIESHRTAGEIGWKGGEAGWTLEDNDGINKAIESMGGKRVKTYRVFGMGL